MAEKSLVKRLVSSFARTPVLDVPAEAKAWPFAGLERGAGPIVSSYIVELLDQLGPTSFERIYRSQHWVAVCVKKISLAAASLPFKSYGRDGNGSRDRLPTEHPLSRLLANPYPGGDSLKFIGALCRDIGIYDNALVVKGYDNGPESAPTQLWHVDWRKVTIIPGEREPVVGFELTSDSGRKRLFRRDECIHLQLHGGLSPLEPLARTLIMEDAANRAQVSSFLNGFRSPIYAQSTERLTDEQKAEFKRLLAAYQGPDGSGGVPLLPTQVTLNALNASSAKDAEWAAVKDLSRVEVAAAYGIDPTQISILDRATFSNVTEAHLGFYMDTLRPWLVMIEEAFRVQMLEVDGWADTFVEFDMADVLKGNIEQRYEAFSKATGGAAWATINEVRRLENLPPVNDRGADSPLMPMNLTPLDGAIPSPDSSPVGQPAKGETVAWGRRVMELGPAEDG